MKSPKVRLPPAAADEDRHPRGCLHGLFHFLDFNQRFHLRKMITYKKHAYGTKSPKKLKEIVSSSREVQESMNKEANLPIGGGGSVANEGSENAIVMSPQNSRGSSVDKDSRRNISPIASRLVRTVSIHRSEGHGYVDSMAPQTESPAVEHVSHFGSFSANAEHIPLVSEASDAPNSHDSSEACGSVSTADNAIRNGKNVKESESPVPFHQSKELLDIMMLLNSNRDLFLKLLSDPSVIANYIQTQQAPTPDAVLERLRSMPAMRSPRRNNCGSETRKSESLVDRHQDTNEESTDENNVRVDGSRLGPENDRASNRFKVIKKRIKDVIKENRTEGRRISMDGVLDKIPYGGKLSDGVERAKKVLERPASARYDTDTNRSLKRSQSVNESLDKYCRLFESTSSFKRASESSKLDRRDECHRSFGRIFSLPEFESYSSTEDVGYRAVCGEQEQTREVWNVSRGLTRDDSDGNPLYNDETVDEADISEEPVKTSLISDYDAPIYASDGFNCSMSGSDRSQMLADDSLVHVRADEKDEAEFNYVRDILLKSGLGGNESSLYVEAECSNESGVAADESDTSLDHQLLFDVTNEVLLDIYDATFAYCPWLSCFDSRIRPMPARHHILEEVWANVNWYLKYQPQPGPSLDRVVARDFAKSDGWMELQYDCEYAGLELEDLMLDELLDELVTELSTC